MSMQLTDFPAEYDADIQTRIFDQLGLIPAGWRNYFNVQSTPGEYVIQTTGYSGFGVMGTWPDGTNIPIDEAVHIFDNSLTQAFYGMGFKVSRKMLDYPGQGGFLRKVQSWANSLARSAAQKMALDHVSVLGNAFTTTYTSLGGVALVSDSHTSAGSTLRSNLLAACALTPANLEAMRLLGDNHINYRGLNEPLYFKRLIVPAELRFAAEKILGSTGQQGTTDNDKNVHYGLYDLLVEPMLHSYSTTAWYLQGDGHGLISCFGKAPSPVRYQENNGSLVHGIETDYTYGVEFWENFAGTAGA